MTGGEYFHETFVRHHSKLTKYTIFIGMFMIDVKITQIFIVFIINHKNIINIVCLVRLLWWQQTFRENIYIFYFLFFFFL